MKIWWNMQKHRDISYRWYCWASCLPICCYAYIHVGLLDIAAQVGEWYRKRGVENMKDEYKSWKRRRRRRIRRRRTKEKKNSKHTQIYIYIYTIYSLFVLGSRLSVVTATHSPCEWVRSVEQNPHGIHIYVIWIFGLRPPIIACALLLSTIATVWQRKGERERAVPFSYQKVIW